MRKTRPLMLAATILVSSVVNGADDSDSSASAFMKCARIASDAQRLSCYDRLATELIELGVSSPADTAVAPAPAQSQPQTQARAAQTDDETEATTQAQTAPSGLIGGSGAGAISTTEEGFGLESVKGAQDKDIKSIQSRFDGEFTGWDGDTVFPLKNGQVWQQIESGRMGWKATDPMITIKRGFMGSYQLSVEGVNKKVRVKRIK